MGTKLSQESNYRFLVLKTSQKVKIWDFAFIIIKVVFLFLSTSFSPL